MLQVLRKYKEDNYEVTEYTRNGVDVTTVEKTLIKDSLPNESVEPKPTLEEIAEENLLETKYQTLLLEMML